MTPQQTDRGGDETISSVERAYRYIREAIISGEYAPNSPLRVQKVATEAGVSIIPVREALRRLEAERLVRTTPNRGARVAGVSLEDARDAYEMRILLESEAIRRSVERLSINDLNRAELLASKHLESFETGVHTDQVDIHRDLHFILYQSCGSKWLLRFIANMWDHTERYRRVGRPPQRVAREHLAIVEALKNGDVEEAVNELREHLENTLEAIETSPFIEEVIADQAKSQEDQTAAAGLTRTN